MTGGKFVLHHPFDLESFFPQLIKEEIYYTLMPPALLDTLAKSQRVNALKQSKVEVVASGRNAGPQPSISTKGITPAIAFISPR